MRQETGFCLQAVTQPGGPAGGRGCGTAAVWSGEGTVCSPGPRESWAGPTAWRCLQQVPHTLSGTGGLPHRAGKEAAPTDPRDVQGRATAQPAAGPHGLDLGH